MAVLVLFGTNKEDKTGRSFLKTFSSLHRGETRLLTVAPVNLVVEVLAIAVISNTLIQGIQLTSETHKISLCTDDAVFFVQEPGHSFGNLTGKILSEYTYATIRVFDK